MFILPNLSLHRSGRVLAAVSLLLLPVCAAQAEGNSPSPAPTATSMTENPLLKESTLDFHYPPFDKIKNEHFAPAYEQGMAEQLKEIAPIAANTEAPTFENTIVALEKTGDLLGRVDRIFSNLSAANTNPALQKIETEMAPKLAAHQRRDLPQRPALQAHRDALQQPRQTRPRRGIELADRALLQGFRPRRRQAFRRRQDQAEEDERRAGQAADRSSRRTC